MTFELPSLAFEKNALSPWTSAETIDYHYGKHHAGYVAKLNAAVAGTPWEEQSLVEIIASTRDNPAIFNNAAQHWNHSFFWNCLASGSSAPSGQLAEEIDRAFGSLEDFKKQFSDAALTLFGSGWAWLVRTPEGALAIKKYKDADSPAGTEHTPVLTLDVWEHAYYIDYRNDRAKFIDGFWDHVNWPFADDQLSKS